MEVCIYYENYKLEIDLTKTINELEETKLKLSAAELKIDELEEKYEKQINFKDELLVNLSSKSFTTRINNNIENLNITVFPPVEEVRRQWEDIICREFLQGGIKTFAQRGHKQFLVKDGQSTVVCADPARNKFIYINDKQVIQYDMKLQRITKRFFEPGAELAREFLRNLDVVDEEDEKLFNRIVPISYISNINSPSNKEFLRHLYHCISLAPS